MTDRELANRCLIGDRSAYETLWKQHSGKMYSVCKRYFDRNEDAQDALQEGFIRVFKHLDQWQGEGPLGAWIRKVMVNTSLNMLKSQDRKGIHVHMDTVAELTENDFNALGRLNEEDLLNLIRQMPAGYRTVFNLFAIEGYSHLEIASMLSVSENTSKTQYHKAKGWLKSRLEQPNNNSAHNG
jgi:RNA polymerase sigma-70 factor (ECF subfamily)